LLACRVKQSIEQRAEQRAESIEQRAFFGQLSGSLFNLMAPIEQRVN